MIKRPSFPQTQQGMVLVVALAILLVISLIAITSMKTAVLEERMATNMQNSVSVFQAAETAVDQAIRDISLLASVTNTSSSANKTATFADDSATEATVAVVFVRESVSDDGGTPDATQAGGSWQGGGVGNAATATRHYEARSEAKFSDNNAIKTNTTQGFFYCTPGCQ